VSLLRRYAVYCGPDSEVACEPLVVLGIDVQVMFSRIEEKDRS
jgi:hypothetical protein